MEWEKWDAVMRVFISVERLFDFQGIWVTAPNAPLPLPQLLSTSGSYVGLACGADPRVGLFCYMRSNSSVLVCVMSPQLSWGLNLLLSCGMGPQLSYGSPHS
jgi:hypothetical protein